MGNLWSAIASLFGSKEVRILMLGLDSAGKTTILYTLKFKTNAESTIPTVGFNVESVTVKSVKFNVWDVGGQDKIRPLWRHYFEGTDGLIFVIDSSDRSRIIQARNELKSLLEQDLLRSAVLLVFANKQDIEGCMDSKEIRDQLGLENLHNREWFLQPCCAANNSGLYEGFEWLSTKIKK